MLTVFSRVNGSKAVIAQRWAMVEGSCSTRKQKEEEEDIDKNTLLQVMAPVTYLHCWGPSNGKMTNMIIITIITFTIITNIVTLPYLSLPPTLSSSSS